MYDDVVNELEIGNQTGENGSYFTKIQEELLKKSKEYMVVLEKE